MRSLFLLQGCVGLLIVGSLSCTQLAAQTNAGATMVATPNSATVQIQKDGTKIIQEADGTTIEISPDGTKNIRKSDGTTIQIQPDGSKHIQEKDGTTIDVKTGAKGS